jgi:Cytochrome P460
MKTVAACLALGLAGAAIGISSTYGATQGVKAVSDAAGNLHVPEDYKTRYTYLGTWSVADDKAKGAKQLHIVYASPGAVAAFQKLGKFPDGSVLVKEVYGATTATMTTGEVSRADKLAGYFVMVKDSKGSHPNNPLWGDGWGWSWFDAGKTTRTTSANYKTDCYSCHIPAQATDWIYTQGYSALVRP